MRPRSLFDRCTYTRTHADTYRYTKYSYMRLILAVWRRHKKPGKISPCANIGRVRCEYFMQADKHADTLTHTHTEHRLTHVVQPIACMINAIDGEEYNNNTVRDHMRMHFEVTTVISEMIRILCNRCIVWCLDVRTMRIVSVRMCKSTLRNIVCEQYT